VIDTTVGTLSATGGSGVSPLGAGATIGQGGYNGGGGAGIQSVAGAGPASTTATQGSSASLMCGVTPMATAAAPAFASAWQNVGTTAPTTPLSDTWLPVSALSAWPPSGITNSSTTANLNLSSVTTGMAGYYFCAVQATGLVNDASSSIVYVGMTPAELTVTPTGGGNGDGNGGTGAGASASAGAVSVPTLNPAALAVLALAVAGLAGWGWKRRGA